MTHPKKLSEYLLLKKENTKLRMTEECKQAVKDIALRLHKRGLVQRPPENKTEA